MAQVYRALGRLPKKKSPWRWVWRVVILLTLLGYVWMADYMNIIDVPLFDQAYDQGKHGSQITNQDN